MNIDPFDAYSDKEIWESLENVRLKEHVKKLDNQLLFECNEEGNNFRYTNYLSYLDIIRFK